MGFGPKGGSARFGMRMHEAPLSLTMTSHGRMQGAWRQASNGKLQEAVQVVLRYPLRTTPPL